MDSFNILSRATKFRRIDLGGLESPPTQQSLFSHMPTETRANLDCRDCVDQTNSSAHSTSQEGRSETAAYSRTIQASDFGESKRILKLHKIKIKRMANGTTSHKSHESINIRPLRSFSELRSLYDLPGPLLSNLSSQGYTTPTEVQLAALPLLLSPLVRDSPRQDIDSKASQRKPRPLDSLETLCDLLTVAPTGSGKTLAYLIPIVNSLIRECESCLAGGESFLRTPRALILAPTKELVWQITNEANKLVQGTPISVSSPIRREAKATERTSKSFSPRSWPHIVVSTPLGFINSLQLAENAKETLPSIQNFVLDEADVLLDPLFRAQTLDAWSVCTNESVRVSLWSATLSSSIEALARDVIHNRNSSGKPDLGVHESQRDLIRVVVGLKDSAIPLIEHKLVYAATEQGKLMAIREMLRSPASSSDASLKLRPPFLIFTQTIPRAIALHSELRYDIKNEAGGSSRIAVLHADLTDNARDHIMTGFRMAEIWVLITTDLLARGVDFRGLNGVVNYDLPNSSAAYVHRVGRTGRAGRPGGIAVTLYSKDDLPYVKNVANVIAASERQKGIEPVAGSRQEWLRDMLPKIKKDDKQRLKQRGVESRRANNVGSQRGDRVNTKAKISTKSGFERKVENRKKGARLASKSRRHIQPAGAEAGSDDEFNGFDG